MRVRYAQTLPITHYIRVKGTGVGLLLSLLAFENSSECSAFLWSSSDRDEEMRDDRLASVLLQSVQEIQNETERHHVL